MYISSVAILVQVIKLYTSNQAASSQATSMPDSPCATMFKVSAQTIELKNEWHKAADECASAMAHRDEAVEMLNWAMMAELDWREQYVASLQMDKELHKEKEKLKKKRKSKRRWRCRVDIGTSRTRF